MREQAAEYSLRYHCYTYTRLQYLLIRCYNLLQQCCLWDVRSWHGGVAHEPLYRTPNIDFSNEVCYSSIDIVHGGGNIRLYQVICIVNNHETKRYCKSCSSRPQHHKRSRQNNKSYCWYIISIGFNCNDNYIHHRFNMNKWKTVLHVAASFTAMLVFICLSRMVAHCLYIDHIFIIAFVTGALCGGCGTIFVYIFYNNGHCP